MTALSTIVSAGAPRFGNDCGIMKFYHRYLRKMMKGDRA
jgi:hypothetical protein